MASGKGTYWANKLLDLALGAQAFTGPATVYLALYTASPNAANASGTEVTGGSYVRKSVSGTLAEWPAASGGVKSNANLQAFVTASATWGTIVSAAIYDASSAGNELYFGDVTVSKTVGSGDTVQFNAASISITET
jgi:hypothetical protein